MHILHRIILVIIALSCLGASISCMSGSDDDDNDDLGQDIDDDIDDDANDDLDDDLNDDIDDDVDDDSDDDSNDDGDDDVDDDIDDDVDDDVDDDDSVLCQGDGEWIVEVVESTRNISAGVSLAVNSENEPYIAYTDYDLGPGIVLSSRTGRGWQFEEPALLQPTFYEPSITITPDGKIHIAAISWPDLSYNSLVHAYSDGATWNSKLIFFDFAICESRITHGPGGDLFSIFRPNTYQFDASVNVHRYDGGLIWHNLLSRDVDIYSGGYQTDIVVDENNEPHILFTENATWDPTPYKYGVMENSIWSFEDIDPTLFDPADAGIDLQSDGAPLVAYSRYVIGSIVIANRSGGSWSRQNIGAPGVAGELDVAVDACDNVHIIYIETGAKTLHYATDRTGQWNFTLVHGPYAGGFPMISMDLDGRGRPHIAVADHEGDVLSYAHLAPPAPE